MEGFTSRRPSDGRVLCENLEHRRLLAGDGLEAVYFDTIDLTATTASTQVNRVDQTVAFNWGSAAPDSRLPADGFSVRWTGKVVPQYSQTYKFYTYADDGVRLYVNNQLVLQDWTAHAYKETQGTIALQAGQSYDLRLEYADFSGTSQISLKWSSTSQAKVTIPMDRLFSDSALYTVGRQIKTAAGEVVRLVGANTPSLEWSNTGERISNLETFNALVDTWGTNTIRLPVSQSRWNDTTSTGTSYRAIVDKVMQAAQQKGVYVILDLHGYKAPDAGSTAFWQSAATRYKNNPHVLFGLFNEPHGTTWEVWRNGGTVSSGTTTYESPGIQGLLSTVRATGAENVIVAGGLDYAYNHTGIFDGGYALADNVIGNGIIYDTHVYQFKGTQWQQKFGNNGFNHPILVGELGAWKPGTTMPNQQTAPDEASAIAWGDRVLDYLDLHGFSWTAWAFHPAVGANLITSEAWTQHNYDPTTTTTTGGPVATTYWGQAVYDRMQAYKNPLTPHILQGTVIGSTGSSATGETGLLTANDGAVAAFDGDYNSFVSSTTANKSTGWVGLDFGVGRTITQIEFMPKDLRASSMRGGIFQASNTPDFSSGVVDLYTIPTTVTDTDLPGKTWTAVGVSDTTPYRYVRYKWPANTGGFFADMKFTGV